MFLLKRFGSNFAANGYGQIVNVVAQLVVVPLFIRFWGVATYGEWLVLSAVPTYFALAEAGFSTVAANELAMLHARKDKVGGRRIMHSLFGVLLMICSGLLGVLILAITFIPWNAILGLKIITRSESGWILLWLGLYTISCLLGNIFNASYRAVDRYARGMAVQTTLKLVELVITITIVSIQMRPVYLAAAWCIVRVVGNMIMLIDTTRLEPYYKLGLTEFNRSEVKRLIKPSLAFMAFPVGNALYFQGITLVVNAVLGPTAVVAFNTTRTMTRVLSQGVALLKHSAWPEFSMLFGHGDLQAARQLNRAIFSLSFWLTLIAGVILFLFGGDLLALWTHKSITVDQPTMALYLTGVIINGMWFVGSGVLMSTNNHEGLAVRYLVSTMTAIIVAYVSCHWWGLSGGPAGMLIAELMLMPYVIRQSCKITQDRIGEFTFDILVGKSVYEYIRK